MSKSTQNKQLLLTNRKTNLIGIGTSGFVLALIALFIGWVPIIGWIVWALGLILSICWCF